MNKDLKVEAKKRKSLIIEAKPLKDQNVKALRSTVPEASKRVEAKNVYITFMHARAQILSFHEAT